MRGPMMQGDFLVGSQAVGRIWLGGTGVGVPAAEVLQTGVG